MTPVLCVFDRARLFPLLFNTNPREHYYKQGRQGYTSAATLPVAASKLPGFAAPLGSYKSEDGRKSKKKKSWIGGCV